MDTPSDSASPFPEINDEWLLRHRSHDVPHLLRRWRAVARAARLRLEVIHETGGFPVYFLTTWGITARPLYFSTGVHGDEAASVLGLLEWAERSIGFLRQADAILIPMFNPVGLSLNTRTNDAGMDLNRCFNDPAHPHIAGWRTSMSEYVPRLAVCLHEDYDAQGLYAYELNLLPRPRPAEYCLSAAQHILPRDPRRIIEGRPARAGVIRRRRLPMFENLPEAVVLYQGGTPCTITFETPSEYSLARRTRAHVRLLQAIQTWESGGAGP
jgi:protein MpaA